MLSLQTVITIKIDLNMAAVTFSSVDISNAAPKDKSTLNTSQNQKSTLYMERKAVCYITILRRSVIN